MQGATGVFSSESDINLSVSATPREMYSAFIHHLQYFP
ncbi:hypothetical protein EL80_5035 [Escherichia coli]|nr:hypothetical protein EL80_5035 [Escherichia coli]